VSVMSGMGDNGEDAEGRSGDSDHPRRFGTCPGCELPVALPADLIGRVTYPDDAGVIADICFGRFNTRVHQCGTEIAFVVPVVTAWVRAKEFVCIGDPGVDTRQSAIAAGWSISLVEDYTGLARHVQKWIERDSRALWETVLDDSFWELDTREAAKALGPVRLLALKLARDGRVEAPVERATEYFEISADMPREDVIGRVRWLTAALTAEQLKRCVLLAILADLGGRLEEAVAAAIPLDCLDDLVLAILREEAEPISGIGPPDVALKTLVLLVAYAVAHRLLDRQPNPLLPDLAGFLVGLYELGERDGVELDQRFWLTPQQFWRLVDADSAIAGALRLGQADQHGMTSVRAQDFLARLGWLELVLDAPERFTDSEGSEPGETDPASLAGTVLTVTLKQAGEDEWTTGQLAAACAFKLVRSNLPIDDLALLNCVAAGLAERASPVALLAFSADSMTRANLIHRTDLAANAAALASKIFPTVHAGPERTMTVLVELGNTFRYLHEWDEALRLYDMAVRFSKFVPEGRAEREAILERNRALVLRDSGRFSEAETILKEQARTRPDDPDAQESLIHLYEHAGRRAEALVVVEEQLGRTDLSPYQSSRFLALRASLRAGLKKHNAAAADCQAAAAIQKDDLWRRLQSEMCALTTDPTDERLAAYVADCERHAIELLDRPRLDNPDMIFTAAVLAVLRQLRTSRIAEAGQLIEKITDRFAGLKAGGGHWMFQLAIGWHTLETAGALDAFDRLRAAVTELDDQLPMAAEASYAMGALSGFAVEDLQNLAVRAGAAAVAGGHNEPADLVPVLDVANGRDLTARASSSAWITDTGPATAENLSHWQDAADADVVTFIDETPTLQLLLQPAGGPRRLVDTSIPVTALDLAVRALRKYDLTNPKHPHRMDPQLEPWWKCAEIIAAVLRCELPGDRELVLIPGRLLVATPLHAAGWPGQTLIADRPVSVSPNQRLLIGRRTPRPHGHDGVPYGLIAVPKAAEDAAFAGRLDAFLGDFRSRAPRVRVASAPEADKTAVLGVLGAADAVFVLCHGVYEDDGLGPGICVSAGGIQPPGRLDIRKDPDLAAFILSWEDVGKVSRSPDLLVSIACSSGRTMVGAGGSRFGLEHLTLANATRFLIAPLWPVDQHSALDWVEAFLEPLNLAAAASSLPLQNVPQIHRAATLALAEKHPHPYHWAAFALTTALRGESP
jgi:tetratricopeptide (TPR) repeat protein